MDNNPNLDIIKNQYQENNIGLGINCFEKNCKGYQNTSIGSYCLQKNELSHNNTAIGFKSLLHSKGKYNSAFGALSGQTLVSGQKNVIIGKHADVDDEDSLNRIVIGQGAIGFYDNSVTLGNRFVKNVYMSQLKNATVHCGGVYIYDSSSKFKYKFPENDGLNGQYLKTDGNGNLTWNYHQIVQNHIHSQSTAQLDSGYNLAMGINALSNITGGTYNCAYGYESLLNLQNGHENIAYGALSGLNLVNGSQSVFLGKNTKSFSNNSNNEIVIGCNSNGLGSNKAVIGNNDITHFWCSEDGGALVYGGSFISTSDRRFKKDIKTINIGLDFINKLNPVSFKWKKDKIKGETRYGFIAQEVEETMNFFNMKEEDYLLVDYNQETDKYSLNYTEFISPIIKSIQDVYVDYNQKLNIHTDRFNFIENAIKINHQQCDSLEKKVKTLEEQTNQNNNQDLKAIQDKLKVLEIKNNSNDLKEIQEKLKILEEQNNTNDLKEIQEKLTSLENVNNQDLKEIQEKLTSLENVNNQDLKEIQDKLKTLESQINKINQLNKNLINETKDSIILGKSTTKNVYMSNDGHANVHCSGLTFYNNNNKSYSLPNKDGLNGQILKTNGRGNLNWTNESNNEDILNEINNSVIIGKSTTKNVYMANDAKANIHCSGLNIYNNNSKVFSLPKCDGLNEQILKTNGKGELSWNYEKSDNLFHGTNIVLTKEVNEKINQYNNGNNNILIGNNQDLLETNNGINQILIGNEAKALSNHSITLGNKDIKNIYMNSNKNGSIHCGNIHAKNIRYYTNDSEIVDDLDLIYDAQDIVNGIIKRRCNGDHRFDTLDSASNIIKLMDSPYIGQTFEFIIVNISMGNFDINIKTDDSIKKFGYLNIKQNEARKYLLRIINLKKNEEQMELYGLS